jgi:hypothetical protein
MTSSAKHFLLLVAFAASCSWAQSPESIIKRRGFEFRPNQETPWGTKLEAPQRLIWIEANGAKYKIDPGAAISPLQERKFIQAYLDRHAEQEVALVAEILLGAPPSVEVALGSPSIRSFTTVLEEPPITQYQAIFLNAKVAKKSYTGFCKFMFIAHQGMSFLVYSKLHANSAKEQSVEPHCDLS